MTDPARLLAALALEREGRSPEAETAYRTILNETPENGFALFLLGALLTRIGRHAEAVPILRRAAAARPDHQDTRLTLGNALRDDPDASIAVFETLPDHAGAQANLSTLLLASGRPGAALTAARRSAELAPSLPDAHIAVAAASLATGDAAAALAAAERAGTHPEAAFYRGTALSRLGQPHGARPWLEAAVAWRPEHFEAWLNLGGVLTMLGAFEPARAALTRAISLQPQRPDGWGALGHLYEHWARPLDQIAALDRAIVLAPDDAIARTNRALARIASGDWVRGFAEAECRLHPAVMRRDVPPPGPRHAGGDVSGQLILLVAEQGFGDTLQFLRYARPLRALGATVFVRVQPPLARLAATMPEFSRVYATDDALPACDWIELPSLPHVFGTIPATVPAPGGYIPCVARTGGGGVGVAWAGNPAHSNDFRRSLPLAALGKLLRAIGSRAVSLQHGARAAEGEAFGLAPFHADDFADTAARIAALDLVITVDTSVAHLAGAMGKPVWLLLSHMGEWRWGVTGDTTPWYDSMRLFRQSASGDWDGVLGRVATALRDGLSV